MRIAVLSDIHSNLEALDAVLARAGDEGVDTVWALGDHVGYGADPQAIVERLASLPSATAIGGNHDLAAVGRFDPAWFNTVAEIAIRWTAATLDPAAREWLAALEPRGSAGEALLVHGSVREPVTEYVTNESIAQASFDADPFTICFFGHTHKPVSFEYLEDGRVRGRVLEADDPVSIDGSRLMLNPGSVGQPRDGDERASFMIVDTDLRTATVYRVAYDIERAQTKIRAAGLPDVLAERLAAGR